MMAKGAHKLASGKRDPLSSKSGVVTEHKTGERYASKAAMAKHEAGESKATQRKEIKMGKVGRYGRG